jgi:NADH-quinone oxidoreductase subunit C
VTPDELVAALPGVLGDGVRCASAYGQVTVDVPRDQWVAAVTAARDSLGLTFFDLLTAVDELDAGFDVVLRLWAPQGRYGLLLRTRCPRDDAQVPSLAGVFHGAAWHEREVWEMFDISFDGHPDLRRLLLPDGFEGHPLRKEFLLASRVDKPWPGAKDPGESDADVAARPRRRLQPPGVVPPGVAR